MQVRQILLPTVWTCQLSFDTVLDFSTSKYNYLYFVSYTLSCSVTKFEQYVKAKYQSEGNYLFRIGLMIILEIPDVPREGLMILKPSIDFVSLLPKHQRTVQFQNSAVMQFCLRIQNSEVNKNQ